MPNEGRRISCVSSIDAPRTSAHPIALVYAFAVSYDSRNRVSGYGGWDFDYDDLNHLSGQSTTSASNLQRWVLQHDLNGNLERLESYNAAGALTRRDVLTYPATNNRVLQETITPAPPADGTGGSNAANGYDLSGFITQQGPVSYQYDDARQMKRYLRSGVDVRYVYDGARRRVLKTGTGGSTRFVYDEANHLIFELNPDGSKRNYVWLGDIPLAVIDQTAAGLQSAVYFIETDFANTPRYLRRAGGDTSRPVWAWAFAPYGDYPATANPDGDSVNVVFNLRYPGQYYDSESKLHYNHTRYYQPRTGRYLQPDLVGLKGGINVYTYANGNPVHYTDPTGTWGIWEEFTSFFSSIFSSVSSSFSSMPSNFSDGIGSFFGKIWNGANTVIGSVWGGIGALFGADVSFGNNAIQFTNHPFMSDRGAITIGNTISYGEFNGPDHKWNNRTTTADHERQHTFQGELLGPLYLPSNLLGGMAGTILDGRWGSPNSFNWNEVGPYSTPPTPW